MSSSIIMEIYGFLHSAEMEVTICHSIIPEIESALQETTRHLQAAQASLKTALTFKPEKEE